MNFLVRLLWLCTALLIGKVKSDVQVSASQPVYAYALLAVDKMSIDVLETKQGLLTTVLANFIDYTSDQIKLYHVSTDKEAASLDGKVSLTIRLTLPSQVDGATSLRSLQNLLLVGKENSDFSTTTITDALLQANCFDASSNARVLSVELNSDAITKGTGGSERLYIAATLFVQNYVLSGINAFTNYRIAYAISDLLQINFDYVIVYDADEDTSTGMTRVVVPFDVDLDSNSYIPIDDQRQTYNDVLMNGRLYSQEATTLYTLDFALSSAGLDNFFSAVAVNMFPAGQLPIATADFGFEGIDGGIYQGRRKIDYFRRTDGEDISDVFNFTGNNSFSNGCRFAFCTNIAWNLEFVQDTEMWLDSIETNDFFIADKFSSDGGAAPIISMGNTTLWRLAPEYAAKSLDLIFNFKRKNSDKLFTVRTISNLQSVTRASSSVTGVSFDGKVASDYRSSLINGKELTLFIRVHDLNPPDDRVSAYCQECNIQEEMCQVDASCRSTLLCVNTETSDALGTLMQNAEVGNAIDVTSEYLGCLDPSSDNTMFANMTLCYVNAGCDVDGTNTTYIVRTVSPAVIAIGSTDAVGVIYLTYLVGSTASEVSFPANAHVDDIQDKIHSLFANNPMAAPSVSITLQDRIYDPVTNLYKNPLMITITLSNWIGNLPNLNVHQEGAFANIAFTTEPHIKYEVVATQ